MSENSSSDLSPKQRIALESLLAGNEVETVAAAAGVTATTIYRWKRQKAFQGAMRDAQADLVSEHTAALSGMLRGNRDVLVEIRDDPDTPAHVRLRAVEIIESTLRSWREFSDFEERLTALEAQINATQNSA